MLSTPCLGLRSVAQWSSAHQAHASPQSDSQHHKWEEVSCFNGDTESAYAAAGRGREQEKPEKPKLYG